MEQPHEPEAWVVRENEWTGFAVAVGREVQRLRVSLCEAVEAWPLSGRAVVSFQRAGCLCVIRDRRQLPRSLYGSHSPGHLDTVGAHQHLWEVHAASGSVQRHSLP